MNPDHIKRIIERIDPADREALEQHLAADENRHKTFLQCLDDNAMVSRERDELVAKALTLSQEHEKLRQENAELRLSNQEMNDWIAGEVYQDGDWEELNGDYRNYAEKLSTGVSIIESAPATRLAELKALAISEAVTSVSVTYNLNEINALSQEKVFDMALHDYDQALLKYANYIREEAE